MDDETYSRWSVSPIPYVRRRPLGSSDRLDLRPLRRKHREDFFASIDAEVMRWQGWNEAAISATRRSYSARTLRRLNGLPADLMIADRATGAFVGSYAFYHEQRAPSPVVPSVGWWLAAPARGRGLGSESLRLVLEYAHEHLELESVQMATTANNVRSLAQMAAAGAEHLADEPHTLPDGDVVDGRWFIHRDQSARRRPS